MKIGHLFGIVDNEETSSTANCLLCDKTFPKTAESIKEHTNDEEHKDNVELWTENGLSLMNKQIFCRLCNKDLDNVECVSKHIKDNEHSTWMTAIDNLHDHEFINIEKFLSSEEDDLYCEVCQCSIDYDLPTLEEHVNNFNHRTNVVAKLKPMNGIFPVDNDAEVWCKLCDEFVENTLSDIVDHIDGDEHSEWFDNIEEVIDNHDISIDEYLANEHYAWAYCNRCDTEVICDVNSLDEHCISEDHLNNF